MNKETLISYIGKGEVNHKGYKIKVTKDYLEKTQYNLLQIELLPINNYTDSAFFKGFLECIDDKNLVNIDIRHVDGSFNALEKKECINWLKEDVEDGNCRILTNARCLSEGVDVPALDAVMFLNPRSRINIKI